MTEERNQLADLFAACWKDETLKQRFMSDPKAVLAEYGMDVPDGMAVNVVENTDNTVHITMPAPPSGGKDLSDDELRNDAGGSIHSITPCRFCSRGHGNKPVLTTRRVGGVTTD